MTNIDLKRILNSDKVRLIDNAKNACANSQTDWAKNYWFNVLNKLCEKYGTMDYFRKVIH